MLRKYKIAISSHNLDSVKLTEFGECPYDQGGYFIINGNERIVRMLIMNKRNYPVAF